MKKLIISRQNIKDADTDEIIVDFSDTDSEKRYDDKGKFYELFIHKKTKNFETKIIKDEHFFIVRIVPRIDITNKKEP